MRSLATGALVLGMSLSGIGIACAKDTDDLLKDVEAVLSDAPKPTSPSASSAASTDASHSSNTKADVSGAAKISALSTSSSAPSSMNAAARPSTAAAAGSVAPVGFLATQQAGATAVPNGVSTTGPAPIGGFAQFRFSQQQAPSLGGVPPNPFAGQMQPQALPGMNSMRPQMPQQYFGGMVPNQPLNSMRFASSAYHGNVGGGMPSQRMMPMQNVLPQQRMQQPSTGLRTGDPQQAGVGLGGRKPWAPTNSAHSVGGVPPPTSLLEKVAASSSSTAAAAQQQQQQQQQEHYRAASRSSRKAHDSSYKSVRSVATRNHWSVESFHKLPQVVPSAVRDMTGLPPHLLDAGEEYKPSPVKMSHAPKKLALVEERGGKYGDIASFVETSKAGDGRSEVAVRQGNGMHVSKREQAQLQAQQLAEQKAQAQALITASIYDYGSRRVGEPGSTNANEMMQGGNPEPVQVVSHSDAQPTWKYDKSSEVAAAESWLEKQRAHSLIEQSRDEVDDPVGAGVPNANLQLDDTVESNEEAPELQVGTGRFKETESHVEKQKGSVSGIPAFYAVHGGSSASSTDDSIAKKGGLRGRELDKGEIAKAHKKALSELHDALARLRQDVGDDMPFSEPRFESKPLSNEVLDAEEERAAQSNEPRAISPSHRNLNPGTPNLKMSESGDLGSSNIVKPAFDNQKPLVQEAHRERSHHRNRKPHLDSRMHSVEKPAYSNKQPLSARDKVEAMGANSLRFQSGTSAAQSKAQALRERAMKNKNSFPVTEKLHWHGWVKDRKERAHNRILQAMEQQLH